MLTKIIYILFLVVVLTSSVYAAKRFFRGRGGFITIRKNVSIEPQSGQTIWPMEKGMAQWPIGWGRKDKGIVYMQTRKSKTTKGIETNIYTEYPSVKPVIKIER